MSTLVFVALVLLRVQRIVVRFRIQVISDGVVYKNAVVDSTSKLPTTTLILTFMYLRI